MQDLSSLITPDLVSSYPDVKPLYTKLAKYAVLIYAAISFISNAKKLSILGTKEKESSKEEAQINEDIGEENTDPDSEMLRNKPELKSKSEKIVEKYKKE